MDIFKVLTMLGGLALFLFGMQVMGEGLEKRAGNQLKGILEKMTSNPIKGVLLGIAVTAVIQSSSATTVMIVGFVNSGIMQLSQAIGVIMGANVGTTVTSWILSLSGIQGDNFFVNMLKPSSFSPILAIIGVGMLLFSKSSKKKDTASIMLGFAVLMFGMQTMTDADQPLASVPEIANLL
ncbi:MAG: Na/Pi symporter, partial [Oscillospiraceae bacterium]